MDNSLTTHRSSRHSLKKANILQVKVIQAKVRYIRVMGTKCILVTTKDTKTNIMVTLKTLSQVTLKLCQKTHNPVTLKDIILVSHTVLSR